MSHAAYEEAIANLSLLIPELLGVPGQPRRKFSLEEIGILSATLGNPHKNFPSVLVAGTNGKGSTSATLASIARAAGLRVGLYTSPHLERVNERIRLLTPQLEEEPDPGFPDPRFEEKADRQGLVTGHNFSRADHANQVNGAGRAGLQPSLSPEGSLAGQSDIPDETFARLYFRVHDAAQQTVLDGKLPALPSYFELLTALAFLYFSESQVDLAVLEVGMGGRLDATNIVTPILSVITDISLDHQEWLGSTIDLIAREKAGILRPNGTLITLPQHPLANQALGEVATQLNVRGVSAADYIPPIHTDPIRPYEIEVLNNQIIVDSPLKGAHQHRNIALAIAAAVELNSALPATRHHPITPAAIEQGIQSTHWPGRLETIGLPNPFVLWDAEKGALKGRGFSRAIAIQESLGALAPEATPPIGQTEFILDVAHNPAGAWALRAALAADQNESHFDSAEGRPQHAQCLIFACLRDKPLREMTQILFPIFYHVILAPIHSPRATEIADLLAAAEATGVPSQAAATVEEAIQLALQLSPRRVVISGSLYLVGEARHILLSNTLHPALQDSHR